jgi:hypothetical protein
MYMIDSNIYGDEFFGVPRDADVHLSAPRSENFGNELCTNTRGFRGRINYTSNSSN